MSKKLKILFTCSIILNVILIGVMAGGAFKKWQRYSVQSQISELSPESRNLVMRNLQKARQDNKKDFEATRNARKDLKKVMQAEEFNEQAFDQAAQKLQSAMGTMMQSRFETMKGIAKQLPASEREHLSLRLLKSDRKRQRKRDRGP